MTTLLAQGPVDVNVRGLLDRLQARADNAYCDYIGLCRRDECLGWEAKVEKQIFGEAELKAHKDAAEKLGRHRALQEAANLLHELLTPNALNSGAAEAKTDAEELSRLRILYDELLMAVGNKYPGETRHKTALRYIRTAEIPVSGQAKDCVPNAKAERPETAAKE